MVSWLHFTYLYQSHWRTLGAGKSNNHDNEHNTSEVTENEYKGKMEEEKKTETKYGRKAKPPLNNSEVKVQLWRFIQIWLRMAINTA